jgi:hypothetical protein
MSIVNKSVEDNVSPDSPPDSQAITQACKNTARLGQNEYDVL